MPTRSNIQSIHPDDNFSHDFEQPTEETNVFKWVVVVIVIALLLLGGLYIISKYTRFNVLGLSTTNNSWQAVFLSNGQVYFGKVVKANDDVVVLRDIYYLQITQPLQRSGSDQNQPNGELSLVKLGNELHGPEDEMRINYQHVLFIEDLKPDSKVVQAIENYKAGRQ